MDTVDPLLRDHIFVDGKSCHINGVTSLEGDNLEVFYYLIASEIWPYNRSDLFQGWAHPVRGPPP